MMYDLSNRMSLLCVVWQVLRMNRKFMNFMRENYPELASGLATQYITPEKAQEPKEKVQGLVAAMGMQHFGYSVVIPEEGQED